MRSLCLRLSISADAFLDYYRGSVRSVLARSQEGLTVRFPASSLQRFVTTEGIHGTFRLTFDDQSRFVSMERVTE